MVSEADVGGVEEGQEVTFTVDAFPNRKFNGIVSQVRFAPITNQNVVSYTCVVDVNNRDLKLRPGMTATASIITGRRDDVLLIPNAALRFRPPENLLPKSAETASKAGFKTAGTNAISGAFPNEGGGANQGEMRRRFESMTPEQQEEARARFRAMRGSGGGPGGSRQRASEGPATRVVYVLDQVSASGKPSLRAVTIKTGLADSSNTEVLEGLSEGDVVVTAINTPLMAQTAVPQGTLPFGGPFGGGRR